MKLATALLLTAVLDAVNAFVPAKPCISRCHTPPGHTLFDTLGEELTETDLIIKTDTPYLLFPGGGIFFYWQAGVVTYLREKGYKLDDIRLGGASAGALTATLTATDVDFYQATELALSLAKDAGVWDRKGGLQGIWGPMIDAWLDELLPDDAVEKVNNRLSLLVTEIPSFQRNRIESYQSRQDLIDCNMASVHLPWFLDGKLTTSFRDSPHIDGSFLCNLNDFGVSEGDSKVLMPSYAEDPNMDLDYFDFIKTVSPDTIYGFLEKGKAHAKLMEEGGKFKFLSQK